MLAFDNDNAPEDDSAAARGDIPASSIVFDPAQITEVRPLHEAWVLLASEVGRRRGENQPANEIIPLMEKRQEVEARLVQVPARSLGDIARKMTIAALAGRARPWSPLEQAILESALTDLSYMAPAIEVELSRPVPEVVN
ncbi:hypothetical protein CHELA1G11_70035 [Hyphomicrobiales bacterium]|jgi:hypothetical protein|nr:hypothetical protein CHELA1G2_60021 [Hyphomicrobiales bacterium]CAH1696929.1 hypothetical protein CHELA1G11_70035 [Hyphomicrobiales bacterium]